MADAAKATPEQPFALGMASAVPAEVQAKAWTGLRGFCRQAPRGTHVEESLAHARNPLP
jgi:hypothetical protein